MGNGSGSRSAARPAPVATRAVSSAKRRDPCRASKPITSGPVALRAASQVTRPAAAARTTARFMPFGPARSGPRSPAVPNCERSGETVGEIGRGRGQAVEHRAELVAGRGIRVVGEPGLSGGNVIGHPTTLRPGL